jgi:hypothetical protein
MSPDTENLAWRRRVTGPHLEETTMEGIGMRRAASSLVIPLIAWGGLGCGPQPPVAGAPTAPATEGGTCYNYIFPDTRLVVRLDVAKVVESLNLFWGKGWKWAGSRFEAGETEDGVSRASQRSPTWVPGRPGRFVVRPPGSFAMISGSTHRRTWTRSWGGAASSDLDWITAA